MDREIEFHSGVCNEKREASAGHVGVRSAPLRPLASRAPAADQRSPRPTSLSQHLAYVTRVEAVTVDCRCIVWALASWGSAPSQRPRRVERSSQYCAVLMPFLSLRLSGARSAQAGEAVAVCRSSCVCIAANGFWVLLPLGNHMRYPCTDT